MPRYVDGEELRPSDGKVHIDEQKLVLKNVTTNENIRKRWNASR